MLPLLVHTLHLLEVGEARRQASLHLLRLVFQRLLLLSPLLVGVPQVQATF
jgi:hypothetical protein